MLLFCLGAPCLSPAATRQDGLLPAGLRQPRIPWQALCCVGTSKDDSWPRMKSQYRRTPMASSVTATQCPRGSAAAPARCAQVCITRARVYALLSRARSSSVASSACFAPRRAAAPVGRHSCPFRASQKACRCMLTDQMRRALAENVKLGPRPHMHHEAARTTPRGRMQTLKLDVPTHRCVMLLHPLSAQPRAGGVRRWPPC